MAVIGAAVAVLVRGAAEFGHADEHYVAHAVAHVLMKRSDSLPKVAEQVRKLALHAAFVDVMIPAAAIEECDFQADVRLEQLRDFLEALAKAALGILRAVFRLVCVRIDFFQLIHGFESFRADAAQRAIHRLGVHRFETAFGGQLRPIHFELLQVRNRNRGSGALQRARQVRAESYRAERRRFSSGIVCSARFSQPSSVAFLPGVPDSM